MKNFLFRYKSYFLRNKFLRKKLVEKKIAKGELLTIENSIVSLESAEVVLLDSSTITSDFTVGVVYDGNEYTGYHKTRSYYPKFERFLKKNNIKYVFYDIYASDWIEKAKEIDMIVWHTSSDPCTQALAKSKLYILDKKMNKKCLPSYDEVWTYEDKVHSHYLYSLYNLPEIPTFVSQRKSDVISFLQNTTFPIISKITTGSGSSGVEKIDTYKEAKFMVDKVFSFRGRKTYFPFERQKDYVYFQKFINDADFDLRVMVIGDKFFGYYRYPKVGDYKASGAGIYEKKEIPIEALELAHKVKKMFNCRFLATDMLYSKKEKKFFIIESSIFIGVDTCEQLVINGVPGYYQRDDKANYTFKEGKYWLPELMLKECF